MILLRHASFHSLEVFVLVLHVGTHGCVKVFYKVSPVLIVLDLVKLHVFEVFGLRSVTQKTKLFLTNQRDARVLVSVSSKSNVGAERRLGVT